METAKPVRGSTEHYVDLFRKMASSPQDVMTYAFICLEDVATAEIVLAPGSPVRTATDDERLQRIRNIVAAGRQVSDELEAARR